MTSEPILCKNCNEPIEFASVIVMMPVDSPQWMHVHGTAPVYLKNCLLDSWIRKHPDDPRSLAEIIEHVFSVAEPPDGDTCHVKHSSEELGGSC